MKKNWIKKIILAAGCICALGAGLFLAYQNCRHFENSIIDQTKRYLVTLARSEAQSIESSLQDIRQDIARMSENVSLMQYLKNPDPGLDENTEIQPWRSLYRHLEPLISEMQLIDRNGSVIQSYGSHLDKKGVNLSCIEDVKYALENQSGIVTEIMTAFQSEKSLSIIEPVIRNGMMLGALRVLVSMEDINAMALDVVIGDSGYAWVLDEKSIIASHPDRSLIGKHTEYVFRNRGKYDPAPLRECIEQMLSGADGSGEYQFTRWRENQGTLIRKICAYHPIKIGDRQWSICVCIDYNDIGEPIEAHNRNTAAVVILITAFISIFTLVFFIREHISERNKAYQQINQVNRQLQQVEYEKVETANELNKQANLLRNMVNALPYYIYWKNEEGIYEGCNSKFASLAKLENPEQITGNKGSRLGLEKHISEFFDKCDTDIIKTGIPLLNYEQKLLIENREMDLITNKIPIKNPRGKIIGLLGIHIDITDVKQGWSSSLHIEADQQKTARETIQHKLRTPAGVITGFAELLEQENLSDQQKDYVSTIRDNAEKLLTELEKLHSSSNDAYPGTESQPEPPQEQDQTPPKPANKTQFDQDPSEQNEISAVLVVDDVEENRFLIKSMLQKKGLEIVVCNNGKEAVAHAKNRSFDLILMDIQMPVMDGLAATQEIRRNSKNTETAIIAMTASTSKGDEIICLDAGCDDYLSKPLKKELLMRKIDRFIERRRQLNLARNGGNITSSLEKDEEYKTTVEMFVNNLPQRVSELRQAFENRDLDELAMKAHSLKGLGSFAGFPVYTEIAKQMEDSIKNDRIEQLKDQIDEIIDLCSRTKTSNTKTDPKDTPSA